MLQRLLVSSLVLTLFAGCERTAAPPSGGSTAGTSSPSVVAAPAIRTADQLHAALKAKNPDYNGGAQMQWDGTALVELILEKTGVVDLSPLAGLPLQVLYAEGNPIVDLSPLKGMRLAALSLNDTQVADLSPLRGMPL